MMRSLGRWSAVLGSVGLLVVLVLAAVAMYPRSVAVQRQERAPAVDVARDHAWARAGAVAAPGPWRGGRLEPAVLVVADRTLPHGVRERVRALPGVRGVVGLGLASTSVAGRMVTIAGVEPATYRRFAPRGTAESDRLWRQVAAGDVALAHELGGQLRQPPGSTIALPARRGWLEARVGAQATTVHSIDVVVNQRRGDQLGLRRDNALLIAASSPERTAASVRRLVPRDARVAPINPPAPGSDDADRTGSAHLTWGPLASAVGSFRYVARPDGTVRPDPEWVAANIRTESVPLLGDVTCHRVVVPQLRDALSEVSRAGLADAIDPGDYGGCYVPRFIGHDPDLGLSLHTWGIALDLNVATNQRGTAGQMDLRVVAIFKKWGFAWGGDWRWTDPMHFELAAVLRDRGSR